MSSKRNKQRRKHNALRAKKHVEQQKNKTDQKAATMVAQESALANHPTQPHALEQSEGHTKVSKTLSSPYSIVGGIAHESLFESPVTPPTATTPCADIFDNDSVADDSYEETAPTKHSMISPSELTEPEAVSPTMTTCQPLLATADTSFTFESSSAFPCNYGEIQRLAEFPVVFEDALPEAHFHSLLATAVTGNNTFHAIRDRNKGGKAVNGHETDCTSEPADASFIADIHRPIQDHGSQSEDVTATGLSYKPSPGVFVDRNGPHLPENVLHLASAEAVSDLVRASYLTQAYQLCYAMLVDTAEDVISSKLAIWAYQEAGRLEAECELSLRLQNQPSSEGLQQDMALILYRHATPSRGESGSIPTQRTSHKEDSFMDWDTQRVFFADTDGYTRLVDSQKMMYDIEVASDDGATDFDSVASPLKKVPRSVTYSEPTTASTLEDSDDSIEIESLSASFEVGATFHTHLSAWNDAVVTSEIPLAYLEDEDIIDSCLVFHPSKYGKAIELVDKTKFQQHGLDHIIRDAMVQELPGSLDHEAGHDTNEEETSPTKASDSGGHHSDLNDEISVESPLAFYLNDAVLEEGFPPTLLEPFPEFDVNLPNPEILGDDFGVPSESTKVISLELPLYSAENLQEESCVAEVTESFSSDWASELLRTTLGTESFFTFVMHLVTIDETMATQDAVVWTFLELVNMERKKLGRRPLPSCYSPASLLASKIMPHTIFLGTVSLASFLMEISFDGEGKVTVEELYRVFGNVSKSDLHYQATASRVFWVHLSDNSIDSSLER